MDVEGESRFDAVIAGRLDPRSAIGSVIGLDGVAEALDAVRDAQGPPRVVVKPNGTGAR